ncbi:MAG: metallophosphoesterase [Candidatus Eremiobacteraeota bacterium]|nr:metallophosphoesterase [Candidatus Eremiobacteraeota bacterium]MBC5826511.1 metallophosphoesterase [Candidatus Eremiobacteraeota bacterium]
MPYRIAHIADVHLDASFAGSGPLFGAKRREQLRAAFERVLGLARVRRVDALCIAGDLYEDGRAGPDRAAYLRRTLGELAPMRVFISPGNHDPYMPSSVYRMLEPPPENVTIFRTRRFAAVELAPSLTLWGSAHERPLDRDPMLGGFRCTGEGTHLLFYHGSDRDRIPPGKEAIAPFTSADIERSGAAHAMIGHFHGFSHVGRYVYPGSPEPLNSTESGRHTASFVSIENGCVGLESVDVNHTRYIEEDIDVEGIADAAHLADAVRSRLAELVPEPGAVFCRLRLRGIAPPSLDADIDALSREMAQAYPGTQIDKDFRTFDLDAIEREAATVRAAFVKSMRRQLESAAAPDERAALEKALDYGLLAFSGMRLRP